MWAGYSDLDKMGFSHKVVNHSAKINPFVATDGTHTNRIESSWRPIKDFFRTVRVRSVCKSCELQLNEVGSEAKTKVDALNAEQDLCEDCEGVDIACETHKRELRAVKKDVRKKVCAIYDARADCEKCNEYAETFAEKLIEYLWRRQVRKEGKNPFMEIVAGIRDLYPINE